ncbi:hypothetical protein PSSHI_30670 [Photobacterium sp. R1]
MFTFNLGQISENEQKFASEIVKTRTAAAPVSVEEIWQKIMNDHLNRMMTIDSGS